MCGALDCKTCHPEGYSTECDSCEGTGKVELSDCCGTAFDTDIGICPSCREYCDKSDCGDCDGTGSIKK